MTPNAMHARLLKETVAKQRGRTYSEQRFHIEVVQYLNIALTRATFFLHVANQRRCTPQEGALLKKLGLKAGVPDLILIHAGRAHGIELKSETGRVTPDQRATHEALRDAGVTVAVARTLQEVGDLLQAWGVPSRLRQMGRIAA